MASSQELLLSSVVAEAASRLLAENGNEAFACDPPLFQWTP
jgi:hypothetical protein